MKTLILIFFIISDTSMTYADRSNLDIENYNIHKQKLIKKKLLFNSFGKCEKYIKNSSVELFLNCNHKTKSEEK